MPRKSGIGTGDYQIAELSVGLELDLEQLDLDAAVADKTVSEMITKLNHRAKQLEIRAEIDLTNLENAGTEVDRLRAKEARLNEILDVQRTKLQLLKEQYAKASGDKNVGDGVKGRLSNNVLLQELEVARTESAIRGLSAEAGSAIPAMARFGNAIGLAVAAVGAAALKVSQLTQYAAKSGQELGKFAGELGTTAKEAQELSTTMALGGTSMESFAHFITRLDKRLLSTGAAGDAARASLARYGVDLADGEGHLVGYNEQLRRLAEGYRTAKDAGMGREFLTALGPGANALREVLESYESIEKTKARMGDIFDAKGAEEFVARSKELDDQMNALNASLDQIKVSIGAAFLPFVTDIAPSVVESVQSITKSVAEMSETFRRRYKNLRFQFGGTREEFDAAMRDEAEREAREAAESERKKAEARAKIRAKELEDCRGKLEKFNASLQDSIDAASRTDLGNRLAAIDKQAEKQREELAKIAKEFHTDVDKGSLALVDKNAQIQKEKIIRAFSEQTAAYLDNIYETSLQKRLNQIEREKKAWIQKGLDEARATEAAEEQKKRAVGDSVVDLLSKNRKYVELFRKIMAGQTDGFRGGNVQYNKNASTEERLALAKEQFRRQMLMDAGIDPHERISAFELQSIQQLMHDVKNSMGLSLLDGDYSQIGSNLGSNIGSDISASLAQSMPQITDAVSMAMAGAAPDIARPLADAMGEVFAPLASGEISLGVPELSDNLSALRDAVDRLTEAVEEMSGRGMGSVESNVTVDIGTAVTPDSEAMAWLADAVADRIAPVVEQAIGSDANGY